MPDVPDELFPPFPREDWRRHQAPVEAAVRRVLESGHYVLDAEGEAFETEWAAYLHAQEAVGLASGTDAIGMMLRVLKIGPGDKVVIPSMAPVAVAAGVAREGAEILLADCDPATFTLCPQSLDALLRSPAGRAVKAAVVVHLYGHMADWDGLSKVAQQHGIDLLEDASQAHGAAWRSHKAGTLGRAAAFSFYPTKNLAAMGDAGALVTNDKSLALQARKRRQYGWSKRYVSELAGINSRLDEMQAAILRAKLPALDEALQVRRELAAHYSKRLKPMGLLARPPLEAKGTQHAWHLYVIRSSRRDSLHSYLHSKGVPVAVHYPVPIHLQPAYAAMAQAPLPLVETDRAVAEVLSLPLHPYLSTRALDYVCDLVEAF
ncbi:MAG: hypothetical protein JWO94_1598 [Verrucomicrobiaceae bacterium]|nr:hypothetical protein [Verrucomicrobiaceae bacterium]